MPAIHNDDSSPRKRGLPTLGQEIYCVKTMLATKSCRTVTLTESAVTEMLSDFDFYSSEEMRGEYDAGLVKSMRNAAASIRKQLNMEVK
jgi:hypothetical protein